MTAGERKRIPKVLVGCRDCGIPFYVDARTYDLANEVSDGRFRCDECFEGDSP